LLVVGRYGEYSHYLGCKNEAMQEVLFLAKDKETLIHVEQWIQP
jgi:hypothetical protein